MKNKRALKFIFALAMTLTISSCGSDNSSGGSSSSSTTLSASSSTITSNEGNVVAATSVDNFRELVRTGRFAKVTNTLYGCTYPIYKYQKKAVTCALVTSKSDFLWWDDAITTTKNECTTNSTTNIYEYTKTGNLTNAFGSTKTDAINNLLSLIDNADSISFAYTGYGYNGYNLVIEKDSKVYQIDLRYPIAVNPIVIQTSSSSTSSSGTVTSSSYTTSGCQ